VPSPTQRCLSEETAVKIEAHAEYRPASRSGTSRCCCAAAAAVSGTLPAALDLLAPLSSLWSTRVASAIRRWPCANPGPAAARGPNIMFRSGAAPAGSSSGSGSGSGPARWQGSRCPGPAYRRVVTPGWRLPQPPSCVCRLIRRFLKLHGGGSWSVSLPTMNGRHRAQRHGPLT
jgi:hypothetical protein